MECAGRHTFPCGCSFRVVGPPPSEGALPLLDYSADDIREDCPATWEMLGRGLTKGVFQLENPYVGRKWTKRLKPTSIEHLVALGSILRPGCLAALDENKVSMTEHYCRRKNGEEPVEPFHPAVDAHLADTYAITCYQEQMLLIARDVAAFDLVEQDELRKGVGKKDEQKLAKVGRLFVEKAKAAGVVTEEQALRLWNIFKSSGRYCFNRCISEDTVICRMPGGNRWGRPNSVSVAHMYKTRNDIAYAKEHGHEVLRRKWMRLKSYGTAMSLCEDGRIRPNELVDIRPAGFRPVFRVTCENGHSVRLTDNHKVPTSRGEVLVSELADLLGRGQEIFMFARGEYDKANAKGRTYKWSGLSKEDMRARADGKFVNGAFGEDNYGYTNGQWSLWKKNKALLPKRCNRCGKEGGRFEVDHVDGNRENNVVENLERLCASCHKKKEYACGRTRKGEKGYPAVPVKVLSVVADGECETYDVTMEAPNHNFVVNDGLVVCNSHAACYAVLGYQTAYTKAHFPAQFFCAWLANAKYKRSKDPKEEMAELVEEAKYFGVEVLPPDLRYPEMNFSTDGVRVRFGVAGVKGVGEAMTAKLRQVLGSLPRPVAEMSRWEFVSHSEAFPLAALLRLARVGALDWLGAPRRELVEECKVWAGLTDRERGWVRANQGEDSFGGLVPALKALSLPKKRPPDRVRVRVPRKGREAEVARLREEYGSIPRDSGRDAEAAALEGRINELTKPAHECVPGTGYDGPEGGCATEARRREVASRAMLLERPPSPLVDSPVQTALDEEDLLGVALSVNRTMAFDVSAATCTCLEVASGRAGDVLLGVEVREVAERVTKSGKNPGQKMAILKVSDGTCLLEDVVAFPEAYAEFGRLLAPGAVVLLQGERDRRPNSNSLFVSRVWPAKGSIA